MKRRARSPVRQSAVGSRPSAVDGRPSTVGGRRSAVGSRQSAVGGRKGGRGPRTWLPAACLSALRELIAWIDESGVAPGGRPVAGLSTADVASLEQALVAALVGMVIELAGAARRGASAWTASRARGCAWRELLPRGLPAEHAAWLMPARSSQRRGAGADDHHGRLDALAGRVSAALRVRPADRRAWCSLPLEQLGAAYEALRSTGLVLRAGPGARLGLEPSARRRATGAHFTPRSLCARVVRSALRPVLAQLGPLPSPRALLALRVCDPAMGAGAFLLEACRQLGDALARSSATRLPATGRRATRRASRARERVAQQCLFGVDSDPLAVALGRAALGLLAGAVDALASFGAEHLRHGDALLGPATVVQRAALRAAPARVPGDAAALDWAEAFPAVLGRERPGFDVVVGNPPFLGGKRILTVHGAEVRDRLALLHEGANRNADLAAHFLRRAFDLLRSGGVVGFVVTNTVSQGDTREAGLGWLVAHGASIVEAVRRVRWQGEAAVTTSLLFLAKGPWPGSVRLDGRRVDHVTPMLFASPSDEPPAPLRANRGRAYVGCFVRGMGFTFEDGAEHATPLGEMRRILRLRPSSRLVLLPYIGGEEVLSSPEQRTDRWIVHFGARSEADVRAAWPELLAIVEEKVLPLRLRLGRTDADRAHRARWWRFANDRPELYAAIGRRARVLVAPRLSSYLCFAWLPSRMVFSDQLVVLPAASEADFALLQSRIHEAWARLLGSTLGEGLRYNPSDCVETFPWPAAGGAERRLTALGRSFADYRGRLLRARSEGLTALSRRVHDPDERSAAIEQLRHALCELDRAVLEAYGWSDLGSEPYLFQEQRFGAVRLGWREATTLRLLQRLLELNHARARAERP